MRRVLWARQLLVAALVTCGITAAQAQPLEIRIGWVVTPAQLTPVLFLKPEILEHYGESYTVDAIRFQGSSPQITALAAGELDIAALAFSSFALAIQNAGMEDLRAISDVIQDGVEGHYSSEYFVRGDSDIQEVEDLRGRRVASNGIGGAVDMALRKMLRDHGLEDQEDYTLVEINFPNMLATLQDERVDLVGNLVPFSIPMHEQGARVLFTMKEAMEGPTQMLVWAAREGYLEENHEALLDFYSDYQRALQWFLDPENREEAIQIIADFTQSEPERFEDWLFTEADYYRDPNGFVNVEALQANIDLQRELGFLEREINVPDYVDLTLAEQARERLE